MASALLLLIRNIVKEAPAKCKSILSKCKILSSAKLQDIVGMNRRQVDYTINRAEVCPSGAHFHQFVVPPIFRFRRDCNYGNLAALRLPEDVEGLRSCEYKMMERGVVHADGLTAKSGRGYRCGKLH